MNNSIKIGLVGKMRSGKNTVGDYLTSNYTCHQYAFADGITHAITNYFPTAFDGGKPRRHYQFIGQAFRQLDENVWIDYMLKQMRENTLLLKEMTNTIPNIVVTDVRQLNEATRLSDEGFVIIKVVCPEEIRRLRIAKLGDVMTEEQLNHDTEKQVDLVIPDYEIINDGTIDELYKKIDDIVRGEYFENQ